MPIKEYRQKRRNGDELQRTIHLPGHYKTHHHNGLCIAYDERTGNTIIIDKKHGHALTKRQKKGYFPGDRITQRTVIISGRFGTNIERAVDELREMGLLLEPYHPKHLTRSHNP